MLNLPPYDLNLEEVVLGTILLTKNSIDQVAEILPVEAFYGQNHSVIYSAMVSLSKENKPIDILTTVHKLRELGKLTEVGGPIKISSLTDRIAGSSNLEYHCRVLLELFLKREYIRISNETIGDAYSSQTDVFEVYQRGITSLEAKLSGVMKYDVSHIGKVSQKIIAESRLVVSSGQKSGVPTGYTNLDKFTNGWQKTDLIILAGRPAMGKSVCALAFALNPSLQNKIPTAIFSLEMSNEQLVGRAQSSIASIDSSRIIKKQLTLSEIAEIEKKCDQLNTAPIYIDDTPSLTLMDLKGKARRLVKEKGVKLIIIDYLQLMTIDSKKMNVNREQEVSLISRGLKALAKELDIPIIALSQLNRLVESRQDKKPLLSDLRESGSIEQDADMVIFTYRPEYYGINEYVIGNETISSANLMMLIVAKHRAGQIGELRLSFNGQYTRIDNYRDNYSYPSSMGGIKPNYAVEEKKYYSFEEEDKLKKEKENESEVPF
jgi:replicative DNA helicase